MGKCIGYQSYSSVKFPVKYLYAVWMLRYNTCKVGDKYGFSGLCLILFKGYISIFQTVELKERVKICWNVKKQEARNTIASVTVKLCKNIFNPLMKFFKEFF